MHIPITVSNKKIPKGTRIIKQKNKHQAFRIIKQKYPKELESLNKN